jgi:hypothetical protein
MAQIRALLRTLFGILSAERAKDYRLLVPSGNLGVPAF